MNGQGLRLYLIRHGESETNRTNTHAGWAQVHLTDKGRVEAQNVGTVLKNLPFERIYTSDICRTIETKECALPGIPSTSDPRLREIHVGTLAGKRVADCEDRFGEEYKIRRQNMDYMPWDGENYTMFCDRIRAFFSSLAADADADPTLHTVAAFTHGGLIHASLDLLIGGELSDDTLPSPQYNRIDKSAYACENCAVFLYEYKNGKWHLISWNCFPA